MVTQQEKMFSYATSVCKVDLLRPKGRQRCSEPKGFHQRNIFDVEPARA